MQWKIGATRRMALPSFPTAPNRQKGAAMSQDVLVEPLETPAEMAKKLKISEKSLWNITEPRGSIPCVRIGRSVRYRPSAVFEAISRQQSAAAI